MSQSTDGSETMVRVKDLGKCYHIYSQPRDRLHQMLRSPFHVFNIQPRKYYREFWALQGVDFELNRGEILGVLGMNGSGKSTLLQLINGTLTPTHGTVELNGKVAALLELGAGFNPEFSGRENVYMNCSVMGLSEAEIARRYDDIVGFADIGDFLEQPVKTYSSGMYIRLAFAAAINVDPDILIIDEALAVGDARFQYKCFNRLEELKKQGVTIIFVTHAADIVKSFCTKGMVMDRGRVHYLGTPQEATVKYFDLLFPKDDSLAPAASAEKSAPAVESMPVRIESAPIRVESPAIPAEPAPAQAGKAEYVLAVNPELETRAKTFGKTGAIYTGVEISGLQAPNIFGGGERMRIRLSAKWLPEAVRKLAKENTLKENIIVGAAIADVKGTYLFGLNTYDKGILIDPHKSDGARIDFDFVMPHLQGGTYFLMCAIALGTQENHIQMKWYDALVELHCVPNAKYVYGVFHLDNYAAEVACA